MAKKLDEGLYYGFLKTNPDRTQCIGTSKSKGKGTPYVYFDWEITHFYTPEDEAIGLDTPVSRTASLYMSDDSWQYTEPKLLAMEFTGFKAPAVAERYVTDGTKLRCKHNDKGYEEWELVEWGPVGAFEREPLDANLVRTFDAKFNMAKKAAQKPAGKPGAPPQRKGPSAATPPKETAGDGEPAGGPGEGNDDPEDDLKY